jgi:hypothetical protein
MLAMVSSLQLLLLSCTAPLAGKPRIMPMCRCQLGVKAR